MDRTVAAQLVSALIEAGVQRRVWHSRRQSQLSPIVDAVRRSGGSAKGGQELD